ncbi:MAG: NAD(P)H-dependent flavin oxidoreductase [Gammaproteobacteria bacterium]
MNKLIDILGIEYPILQAPMIGGFSDPDMVSTVSNSGGLGCYAGGNLPTKDLTEQCELIKKKTNNNFAVNFFVSNPHVAKSYRPKVSVSETLQPYYDELEIKEEIQKEYNLPVSSTLSERIDVILDLDIPIVSFTFGLPSNEIISKLQKKNVITLGTATTIFEAKAIQKAGLDAVILQGIEAGGHRGSFPETRVDDSQGLMSLIAQTKHSLSIPIIATGGIMNGSMISACLKCGASAAQLGTAFLFTEEAGLDHDYLEALGDKHKQTCLTKSFTGKYARVLKNRFTEQMESKETASFPYQNILTMPIRSKAIEVGEKDLLPYWAGQTAAIGRAGTAEWLMKTLIEELQTAHN